MKTNEIALYVIKKHYNMLTGLNHVLTGAVSDQLQEAIA